VAAYEKGGFSGIGFVVTEDDAFAGVDLDHVRDIETGHIATWAQTIVDRLCSYSEISPSGTG
jgi:putative DNA primase/helicase